MKLNNTFGSQDFTLSIKDGIPVLKFNMLRATVNEAKAFKINLINLITVNYRFIIIDFTKCAFIDSSIVGVMITVVKDLRIIKGDLLALVLPGTVYNIFASTGLDRIIEKFDNLPDALLSINH